MLSDTIYDVGLHAGGDTRFYLSQGYRVVAVDAEEAFITKARVELSEEVQSGKLILVHAAVAEKDDGHATFYVSELSDWSSLDSCVAERHTAATAVSVPCRTLASLFQQFGTPVYCKIDIEGADALALESLRGVAELPKFISCEAECSGKIRWSDERSLHTLDVLRELGYGRFKLVDQVRLAVIPECGRFYRERWNWVGDLARRVHWRL